MASDLAPPKPWPTWAKHLLWIVVVKIALILMIKHIWFTAPTIPPNTPTTQSAVSQHVLG